MTRPTLKTGMLAYFDSFAGPIPCKVESIIGTSGPCGSAQTVAARLTAARGGYRRGELVTAWGLHVFPRACLLVRAGSSRILPYDVRADA